LLTPAGSPQRGVSAIQQHPTYSPSPGQPVSGIASDIPQGGSPEEEKRLRALNAERQKSMVSDANKLLRLVKELNDEIARSSPDSLSAEQLRRVAEIEKLARSVKEKMSNSVRGLPTFQLPFQPGQ
jgi:hypothetical protein